MSRTIVPGEKSPDNMRRSYYRNSAGRNVFFPASSQEVIAASLSLQRKLEQNARIFSSSEVKTYKRVMINEEQNK